MSFLDKVKNAVNTGQTSFFNQIGKFKNRKFMEGVVAICACVSLASDGASAAEKQKMVQFIKNSEDLKVFETGEIVDFFNKLSESFDFDADIGKGEAMKYILRLKDQPEAAQLAVRVGIAVAKSDGDFDAQEKAMTSEICVLLGLNPADFSI